MNCEARRPVHKIKLATKTLNLCFVDFDSQRGIYSLVSSCKYSLYIIYPQQIVKILIVKKTKIKNK